MHARLPLQQQQQNSTVRCNGNAAEHCSGMRLTWAHPESAHAHGGAALGRAVAHRACRQQAQGDRHGG